MKHSMSKATRQTVMTASALALSLLLAACGGGSATPPAGSTNTTAPDTTPPTVSVTDNVPGVATGDVTFTVTASEPLLASSFTISDLIVKGGTVGALTFVSPTVATLVVTPTPNSVGTITIDLPAGSITDSAGNATTVAATQATQDFNTIPTTAGNTGSCTSTSSVSCFNFDEAALAYEAFEGLDSAVQAADPLSATNKVGKFIKVPSGQKYAGATIYTTASNKSVSIIGLSTDKKISLRVYSPAIDVPMALKLEDASDPTKYVTKTVLSTKANAWETLTFDYATTLAEGSYSATTTYNKVSFFPNFQVAETAPKTYYIDELTYAIGKAPVISVTPLTFASLYGKTTSSQGGEFGNYTDFANVTAGWADSSPSEFYFGYHMNTTKKAGYLGGYVKAPSNGTAALGPRNSVTVAVGGNPELLGNSPAPVFVVLLIGPDTAAGCTPKAKGTFAITSTTTTPYTLAKDNLTIENACPGLDTPALIWANGVNEVHVQVPADQMQYTTLGTSGYANGLNIGTITFQ